MGLDMAFLPIEHEGGFSAFSQSILRCEGRRELFDNIMELIVKEGKALTVPFNSYRPDSQDKGYGDTTVDPYGRILKYLTVDTLLTLSNHQGVKDNWQNRAVWAYLACLPQGTKIIIYWD